MQLENVPLEKSKESEAREMIEKSIHSLVRAASHLAELARSAHPQFERLETIQSCLVASREIEHAAQQVLTTHYRALKEDQRARGLVDL
jgi:hypothetical protein